MKTAIKRIICLALGLMLLAGAAMASEAYGPEVYTTELSLGQGTTLKNALFWSDIYGRLRSESYIEYVPNSTVVPVVDFGDSVRSVTTPEQVEARLREKGLTMAGGVNGDYFVMATGENLGLLVTDGVLRASSSYHPALGFYADGTAVIGTPQTQIRVTSAAGETVTVTDVNKVNSGAAFILFTEDYGADTGAAEPSLNVIVTELSGALQIGGTMTATVEQVVQAEGPVQIGEGQMLLSLSEKGDEWRRQILQSMQPGDRITVEVTAADTAWNDVVCAVGGMHLLVQDGTAVKGLETGSAPRTAVGLREDGSMVFYTSASYTNGANTTLDQVAVRLTEMGCVSAILLDGGGSTTLSAAYPGGSSLSTVNKPSTGALRSCSNYVVLASTLPADGRASSLWVYPYDVMMLSGTVYEFKARAADQALRAAALPASLNWSVTGGVGTVTGSGVFTAGAAGTGSVTVSGGGLTAGSATVRVVTTPDSIQVCMGGVAVKDLLLSTGDSVALDAVACFNHVDMISQNTCFQWTLDGNIGQVSEDGVLTLGELAGEGILTVSAGETSVQIPITVKGNPFPDMTGHWAEPYTTGLYYQGAIQGIDDGGVMNFHPDEDMNRAQFAVLMANVLKLDTTRCGDVQLPFADLDTIPDWALPAVRAMYAEGLMLGSADGDAVRFNPYASLTRAEGATVIGRAFPEESAAAEPSEEEAQETGRLAAFPDADQVPDWAAEYFDSLIARNIINGMDGKLAPLSNITRAQAAKMLCVLLESA